MYCPFGPPSVPFPSHGAVGHAPGLALTIGVVMVTPPVLRGLLEVLDIKQVPGVLWVQASV